VKFALLVFHFPAADLELSVQDALYHLQVAGFAVPRNVLGQIAFPGNDPARRRASFQIKEGHLNTASALLSSVRVIFPAKTFLL
jgi:hypothetical protein